MKNRTIFAKIFLGAAALILSSCTSGCATKNTGGGSAEAAEATVETVEKEKQEVAVTEQQAQEETKPEPVQEPESEMQEQPEEPAEEPQPEPEPEPAEPVQEPEPEPQPEPEPEPVKSEPVPEPDEDNEYARSVGSMEGEVSVSKETFEADKKQVLLIISELDDVMKNEDYKAWLTYLDDESIKYWSQPANLNRASKRLPVRGLRLRNLQDYFRFVFIPARKQSKVEEIRYETDSSVKAVEVNGNVDTVYYYLHRINGKWKLHIPQLSN